MNRLRAGVVVATVLAAAVGAAVGSIVAPSQEAAAVPSGDVLGTYQVKIRGDGFAARPKSAKAVPGDLRYDSGRVAGAGILEIAARDAGVNDGLVTVTVKLDANATRSLLGPATSAPKAFEGTAAVVGDSISLIASGQPNYVNAMVLRFQKGGKKVAGTWMAVFPALESDLATQTFATGVTVTLSGRRLQRPAR